MPPQNLGCAKIYVIRSFKRKEKGGVFNAAEGGEAAERKWERDTQDDKLER